MSDENVEKGKPVEKPWMPVNIPNDAQIVPTELSKSINKELKKNHWKSDYNYPEKRKGTKSLNRRIIKTVASLTAVGIPLVVPFTILLLVAPFMLNLELSLGASLLVGLSFLLGFLCIFSAGLILPAGMHIKDRDLPKPEHWDVATRLWGLLNKKKSELPPHLKPLAEEHLRYAISAAEIIDWAEANNIPDSDAQVVAAREELTTGNAFLTSVFEISVKPHTKKYMQHLPHETFTENFSNVQILVREWRQHILLNKNETFEGFIEKVEAIKIPPSEDITKKLHTFLNSHKYTNFNAPTEVVDLVREHLPFAEPAEEVLKEAHTWHAMENNPNLIIAQQTLDNLAQLYQIVVICEETSQEIVKVFEAEKVRPKNITTGANADGVKKLKRLRELETNEWNAHLQYGYEKEPH